MNDHESSSKIIRALSPASYSPLDRRLNKRARAPFWGSALTFEREAKPSGA